MSQTPRTSAGYARRIGELEVKIERAHARTIAARLHYAALEWTPQPWGEQPRARLARHLEQARVRVDELERAELALVMVLADMMDAYGRALREESRVSTDAGPTPSAA